MKHLTVLATEGSTYVVVCTFKDEDGSVITPASTVYWKLLTPAGGEVSSGSKAAANPTKIVLSGSDLSVTDTEGLQKFLYLKVWTTYNSSLGAGLPLVQMARIPIDNALDTP